MRSTVYRSTLTVASMTVLEKIFGFFYRILLSRRIGPEGMGYYQMALSVFGVLTSLAVSGLPITLSRTITRCKTRADRFPEGSYLSAAILLVLAFCIPAVAIFSFADIILPSLFTDERAFCILKILLPGLIFCAVFAILRGYFWGNRDFLPYSLFELIEEITMVAVGSLLLTAATDAFTGAKRAALATTVSYTVSFAVALFYFLLKGGSLHRPQGCFRPLLSSSLPITAMRSGSSAIQSLTAILLPVMLVQSGLTNAEATAQYGLLYGMAIPVLFAPTTLLSAIAVVSVPEISADYFCNNRANLRLKIEKSVHLCLFAAFSLLPVLFLLGDELGILIFDNATSGEMIRLACPVLIPMSLTMITTSILNSLGHEKTSLLFSAFGAAITLFCVIFLPAYVGIYAPVVGIFLSQSAVFIANAQKIGKVCGEIRFAPQIFSWLLPAFFSVAIGILLKQKMPQNLLFCAFLGIFLVFLTVFLRFLPIFLQNRKCRLSQFLSP